MASVVNNTRIAKNTFFLYIRTFFVMIITFYTSRVILKILGVDDYGIYQVVGGIVSVFSIISGALQVSISRFITFEIGTGNNEKLHKIFSTSVIIQIIIAIIIFIISEYPAIWFVENKMTLPPDKIEVTKWVFQFSLITFCVNLISTPYNACIIAHEKMKAYAYISIIDVVLRLAVCYAILLSPFTLLISYAALMTVVAVIIRILYSIYCSKHFEECKGKLLFDKHLFREMIGFSGWTFFSNSAYILNLQGITMLMNVYFGLTVNAARGLAMQVETGVLQFINNFTTAINPQITKSYASGELSEMYVLVCRGAKFSCFAMLFMAIPLILEMRQVLSFWLGDVPKYTTIFAQLSLIMGFFDCMGNSSYTACIATGNVKKYSIVVTSIGYMEFIGSWILFKFGAPAISTYLLFVIIKLFLNIARMFLMKSLIGLPIKMYLKQVFIPIFLVSIISFLPPYLIYSIENPSILRIITVTIVGVLSTTITIYNLGLTPLERNIIKNKLLSKISR